MPFNFILTLGLSLILSGCLPDNQNQNSSKSEVVIVEPEIKYEIEHYDIEEIAVVYYQQVIPINDLSADLLPPDNQEKKDHIKLLLKGLLEGPCGKDSKLIFEKLIFSLKKRIDDISVTLSRATEQAAIDKLRERIEILEELEEKIHQRKEDCVNGLDQCTEGYKQQIADLLVKSEEDIELLEQEILQEQNEYKKLQLEKLLNQMQSEKIRLQEIISKC